MKHCLLVAGEEGPGTELDELQTFGLVLHVSPASISLVCIGQEFETSQVVVMNDSGILIFQISALDIPNHT